MAADVGLLDEVARGGPPTLRLYRWRVPALSLGRFQPDADVDHDACASFGVEVVRRPTGGRALLHGGDLTYAVAMPRPAGPKGAVDAVYSWLARGLVTGLATLGVAAQVAHHDGDQGVACFASLRGSDLRVGRRKLVGSAQVNRDGAVLQHGAVLVRRLAFDETDLLAFDADAVRQAERARIAASTVTLAELGLDATPEEVADALISGFASALDLDFTSRAFVAAEGVRQ